LLFVSLRSGLQSFTIGKPYMRLAIGSFKRMFLIEIIRVFDGLSSAAHQALRVARVTSDPLGCGRICGSDFSESVCELQQLPKVEALRVT
jgi:hypothetical protein